MRTEKEIKKRLDIAYKYQRYIEREIPIGGCHWRINKARIELLQWVLGEEY